MRQKVARVVTMMQSSRRVSCLHWFSQLSGAKSPPPAHERALAVRSRWSFPSGPTRDGRWYLAGDGLAIAAGRANRGRQVGSRPAPTPDAQLAALVDASNEAILSADAAGTIITWNRAAAMLYGYAEAEAVGESVNMLTPPAKMRERRRLLAAVKLGEPRSAVDTQGLHRDGSLLEISLTLSRIVEGGAVSAFAPSATTSVTGSGLETDSRRDFANARMTCFAPALKRCTAWPWQPSSGITTRHSTRSAWVRTRPRSPGSSDCPEALSG